jgi:hypothetical protein
MSQLDLFGPCDTSRAIRAYVRNGSVGPVPAKACDCSQPCWWRKGSTAKAVAA